MKKFVSLCIIVLLLALCLITFKQGKMYTKQASNDDANVFLENRILITATDSNLNTNYLLLNTLSKKASNILLFPKTSFSSGTIDTINNTLYYSKRDSNNYVQLYKYSTNTEADVQLTSLSKDSITNADFVVMDNKDNKLYLRVLKNNHRNFTLSAYDLNNGKLNDFKYNTDNDTSIMLIDFCQKSNQVLEVVYSINEQYLSVKESNDKNTDIKPINYRFILIDKSTGNSTQLFSMNKFIKDVSISNEGNNILVVAKDSLNSADNIFEFDVKSGKVSKLDLPDNEFSSISQCKYSSDGEECYIVATPRQGIEEYNKKGDKYKSNSIYYFKFSTKEITKVYNYREGVINGISILK